MVKIINLTQIKEALKNIDAVLAIEEGFIAYSQGRAVIPPVAELLFQDPPGDVHIKYGYIKGEEYFVIKIASGFYLNPKFNLPVGNGLMLLFKQKTGELVSILLDEGYLTNVRTAAAGAVVAKYLAPKKVTCIGIIGAGTQGRMQLEYLKPLVDCREVVVWGVNQTELDLYKKDMEPLGFQVKTTLEAKKIADQCNLIVTVTPSKSPLLSADQIKPGTHITAVGSDTPEKNELDPLILKKADIVVADSLSQCRRRGEIYQALKAKAITREKILELGKVIINKDWQRSSDEQITVADLTGVAVQDMQIARTVFEALT